MATGPSAAPIPAANAQPRSLVETCRLNDVDARTWLADVLARLPDHPARRITELLPWNWSLAQRA